MNSNGWIKLHRKLKDNPRYKDPEWLAVWIHFLLNATHQSYETMFDGKIVTLAPGQFISGRYQIAENTGVHPSKVQRVLIILKNDKQIDQQAGVKCSIFTVLNWQSYQEIDQQNNQQSISYRSATDQLPITKQEDKEVQEAPLSPACASDSIKELPTNGTPPPKEFIAMVQTFWNAYPKKRNQIDTERAFCEVKAHLYLKDILKALDWQKKSEEWTRENGRWIPMPSSYLREMRWMDEPVHVSPINQQQKESMKRSAYIQKLCSQPLPE